MDIITRYERAVRDTDIAWQDFCKYSSDAAWELYCECLDIELDLFAQLPQEYKDSLDE